MNGPLGVETAALSAVNPVSQRLGVSDEKVGRILRKQLKGL